MSEKRRNRNVTRRKFLGQAVGGTAATAVALPLTGSVQRPRQRVGKKVIYKAGEKPEPNRVYSSGIQFGQLLFVSGQGAHDPETRRLVEGPFSNQVRRCLENVKMVLEAAGSSLDRVLKCTVFLTDIAKFQEMNEVYRTFFPTDPPARTTVAVTALPGNSPIEIECIAYVE
ncbi:MAG TPA: Rid family detoxifying hydrolase [Blastocatellia bacterium]|nr:Rid family detoxifying hydrolase [Blastocatellia bacterium]